MADVPVDAEFPLWGLMPKKETGVVQFQSKYPNYDGRGSIIAIFDSGVDPAAKGLQVTPDGETKVIERFDCSGCGDVDTSTVIKKVDPSGCISGLTGRKLMIPETWKNPTGSWRIGLLYPYALYPTKLKERIQEHRKEHIWDAGHKTAFAEATKNLHEFENEHSSKGSNLSVDEKHLKDELEARVEILQNAEKKYNDVGPTYDCVLFHDGTVWRACIDTSETGDLASGPLLGEYSVTHEHTQLTPLDEMTISINVHDQGQTLEVVGMCSTHGTHVAAIAAGYFPDSPELNGVAPGAKIVSLTIGDSRLGSMETGTALVRACIKVMELSKRMKIDVINMSYGEHAHWSNSGRIGDVICSVVHRYGCAWVVSAGNHGPALCTVGAPPDIAQAVLIGVGAYVSPEMMTAAYSMRAKLAGGAFSWSSRGPAADGAAGVSVCAPGGAVTAVARYTLRNAQLMNGTSMAAPHVAGVVAALVSGLKQRNLPYSPYSIKRALENSATYLSHVEPWAQGCGLINIEKTFDHLTTYYDDPERDVTFSVQCGSNGAKGMLLRPRGGDPPRDVAVVVEPLFLRDHRDAHDKAVIPRQIAFNVRLVLTCEASWVSIPTYLDLTNTSRPIGVRVDTSGLAPGAHFASINMFSVSCVEKGPLVRVAVTVLQPEPLTPRPGAPLMLAPPPALFKPSTIKRHFVVVPEDATWAVVRLRSAEAAGETAGGGRFLVHCMQLAPRRSCRSHEAHKLLQLAPAAAAALPLQLLGGVTLEVAIAKYWANIGDATVEYSVEFHGVRAECGPRLVLSAAAPLRAVALRAARAADAAPAASLRHAEPTLRPSEAKLSPLTPRDVLPPNRQIYQLVNTYNFHIAKATEVSPIVSLLCDTLYESEFESQMWMIYNSCKQLMAVGDAYPSKYSVKLEKGDYVLRLNVRHESRAVLDKLQDLPVVIQQRLATPLTLDVYPDHHQALIGGKKLTTVNVTNDAAVPVYFASLPPEKLSRNNLTVGQTLTGAVTFAKDELGRKVDSHPLQYIVCEQPKRAAKDKDKDKPKPNDEFADAYRDFLVSWIAKLEGDKLEEAYLEATAKFPECAGIHVAYLQALDSPTDLKNLPNAGEVPEVTTAWCEQLDTIAKKVINMIDQEKLLAYFGIRNDTRPEANKIKQENEKQRGYLIDALCRRGTALCRLYLLASAGAGKDALLETLRGNTGALLQLADLTDTKTIQYGVWYHFTLQQWARGARLLSRLAEERPARDLDLRLVQAYRRLGWAHLAELTDGWMPVRYPATYRPF